MRYVEKKVELINGTDTSKRDIMSIMFSVGSFIIGLDNRHEINLIQKRQNSNSEKLDKLLHLFEHENEILQKFGEKILNIRRILSKNFNLLKLKLFESEALMYIDALYHDVDKVLS